MGQVPRQGKVPARDVVVTIACVRNSLRKQVKELVAVRALDDTQLEKLTTRSRQAEASSSHVLVAGRG